MGTEARKPAGRREEIVAIAMGLFAEGGSQAVSVREIADHAGILSGSLYTHFKSKTEILDRGVRPYTEQVLRDLREITAQELAPREAIQLLVRRSFESMVASRDAASIMYSEWSYLTSLAEFEFLRDFGAEVQSVWLRVLRAGVESGTLAPDVDPEIVFRLLRELMAGVARRYRPGGRYSPDLMAEYLDRMIFGGLDSPRASAEAAVAIPA